MDFSAALIEENRLLRDLVRDADPAAPVPTCPEWTLTQLVRHVGRGDRWAGMIVRDRADAPVDPRAVPDGKPTGDLDDWLAQSPQVLLDAVAATGPDTPVWTFMGPRPAAWWIRRRLHETVVHRADVALALEVPFVVDPAVAADSVSEWLSLVVGRKVDTPALAAGTTLHLHATDDGLGEAGEWLVHGGAEGLTWEHGHAKGAAAVRGTAAELLLALLRRLPAERVQVLGDAEVVHTWLARTPF
ncbi:maleylpyruvate isomerase N-terminal domain-containing protein [Actinokineospora sp.]|uniref:maleylpyruvate isomerase N-terminal domain-containing protein n=1 Tax=Actinokineospora sp. TaxID=1872133 RepID=UPI0040384DFA